MVTTSAGAPAYSAAPLLAAGQHDQPNVTDGSNWNRRLRFRDLLRQEAKTYVVCQRSVECDQSSS